MGSPMPLAKGMVTIRYLLIRSEKTSFYIFLTVLSFGAVETRHALSLLLITVEHD